MPLRDEGLTHLRKYFRWYGKALLDGDHEIEGKTYYFSNVGVNLRKAFRKEGSRRKYYGEDGVLKINEWFSITSTATVTGPATMEIDGNEYRINKNGVMVTDWQKDKSGLYGDTHH